MKRHWERTFSPSENPPSLPNPVTQTHTYWLHKHTHVGLSLLTSRCLATSQHAWLWQADVSALKRDASWGIVFAASYITHKKHPTPPTPHHSPLVDAATLETARTLFAADPRPVSQRTHARARASGSTRGWALILHTHQRAVASYLCAFGGLLIGN